MIRRFARPYAKALSEIITAPAEVRKVYDELTRFEEARRESRELAELFEHPGIDPNAKRSVLRAVGQKLEISELGHRVLEVLTRNHRINDLGSILEAWKELINRAAGIAVAEVRVAHELSEGEQDRLRQALEAKLGRRVELQLSIDPALLAGFVAKIGSDVYDASVTGRIEKLRESFGSLSS